MKHTPTPWTAEQGVLTNGNIQVRSKEHGLITVVDNESDSSYSAEAIINIAAETEANARRIVACVNACEGMDDPAVEIAKLKADKAALLDLAATTLAEWEWHDDNSNFDREEPPRIKAIRQSSGYESIRQTAIALAKS